MSATIETYDAEGNLTARAVIPDAHEGHPNTCTMWCQECYFEACGAYETITGPLGTYGKKNDDG